MEQQADTQKQEDKRIEKEKKKHKTKKENEKNEHKHKKEKVKKQENEVNLLGDDVNEDKSEKKSSSSCKKEAKEKRKTKKKDKESAYFYLTNLILCNLISLQANQNLKSPQQVMKKLSVFQHLAKSFLEHVHIVKQCFFYIYLFFPAQALALVTSDVRREQCYFISFFYVFLLMPSRGYLPKRRRFF